MLAGTVSAGVLLAACGISNDEPRLTAGPDGSGSRAEAVAYEQVLLSELQLPPGTAAAHISVVPWSLRAGEQPFAGSVNRGDEFAATMSASDAFAFILNHAPAALGRVSTYTWKLEMPEALDAVWEPKPLPPGIAEAELEIRAGTLAGGQVLISAATHVVWYPPRSHADDINAARYQRLIVETRRYRDGADQMVSQTYSAKAVINRVANFLNRLPGAPPTGYSCASAVAEFQLSFTGSDAPSVHIVPDCGDYSVTIGGNEEPSLAGQSSLTTLLAGLGDRAG